MGKIVLIFSEYFLLPIFAVAFPFFLRILDKNKRFVGRELILEILQELIFSFIFCIIFFALGVQTNAHLRDEESMQEVNNFVTSCLVVSLVMLLVSTIIILLIKNNYFDDLVLKLKICFGAVITNGLLLNFFILWGMVIKLSLTTYEVALTTAMLAVLIAFITLVIRALIRKTLSDTTAITNGYGAAYLDAQYKRGDKAIKKYEDLIKNFGANNIFVKEVFFRLSELYEAKGTHFYEKALNNIDAALKLLKNKRINQNEDYVKYAYLYKYQFFIRNGEDGLAKELLSFLTARYPKDSYLSRKLQSLSN